MDKSSPKPYQFSWFDWFCLWYPPGWLILFNRHWQHYWPDPDGWNGLEYVLFLLPGGFYIALAMRWLRLQVRSWLSRSLTPPPPTTPDLAYQKAFQQEILLPIVTRYFRGTLHSLENLPEQGPLIVAMNHAGMCFPWDFVGLGVLLNQQPQWVAQPLAHPIFFEHPWLTWWLPKGWAAVLGGVRAERQSFEAAVQAATASDRATASTLLLYAPEGWRGLSKGWQQRYQLQTFDPSFLRLSLRYQVPILPVLCLGSEYLHPLTKNIRWLAQRLKLPLFPISPLVLVFLLFPSMGVWAMRTPLRYYIQPVIYPWKPFGLESEAQAPRSVATYHLAADLRSHLQTSLNHLRHQNRGADPVLSPPADGPPADTM